MECGKCKNPIRLGKVTYNGDHYHNGCFSCEVCKKSLKPFDKIEVFQGKFYDVNCFEQAQENICNQCGILMTENCIEYGGKGYHEECFVCGKCNKALAGKFFKEDGIFIDEECYNKLNSLTCDQCREEIHGTDIKFVTYHEKYIHHACFVCSECRKQLSVADKFRDVKTTVKGALICIKCSETGPTRRSSHTIPAYLKI